VDLGLRGKLALVTASSRGIGRAYAEALAREGARVIISSRDEGALRRAAREISAAAGSEVLWKAADLTSRADMESLADFVEEAIHRMTSGVPVERAASPEEVVWVVTFLASERASYVTGAMIPVDGGRILSVF